MIYMKIINLTDVRNKRYCQVYTSVATLLKLVLILVDKVNLLIHSYKVGVLL